MPICTTCTEYLPYLYTVYESADNLRLEQCPKCLKFADQYVEHDDLNLILDLILLKRGVFRHLLFNRGYKPRLATNRPSVNGADKSVKYEAIQRERESARRATIIQLGLTLIFIDAYIRWTHLDRRRPTVEDGSTPLTKDEVEPLMRIFAGCIIETFAFNVGVTLTSALVLKAADLISSRKRTSTTGQPVGSGIKAEFRLSHVPLTLLYSSLTKLFLLLLLSLWKPSTSAMESGASSGLHNTNSTLYSPLIQDALSLLDDDKLDREWIVRNVLGGMAAGFGLRVVLNIHPFFTTIIVFTGWAVKTFVANLLHPWVSGGAGDVFLAYSIP